MQSRTASLIETVTGTVVGWWLSFAVWQWVAGPLYLHGSPPLRDNVWITSIFTIVSLVRGYALRRLFNNLWRKP